MTRIDSARIVHILSLLASGSAGRAQSRRKAQCPSSVAAANVAARRDLGVLRSRLRARLRRLRQESDRFDLLAPEVAVREVLIWEFGEEVLNHSEFNKVASEVALAMKPNAVVARQFERLIAEMIAE